MRCKMIQKLVVLINSCHISFVDLHSLTAISVEVVSLRILQFTRIRFMISSEAWQKRRLTWSWISYHEGKRFWLNLEFYTVENRLFLVSEWGFLKFHVGNLLCVKFELDWDVRAIFAIRYSAYACEELSFWELDKLLSWVILYKVLTSFIYFTCTDSASACSTGKRAINTSSFTLGKDGTFWISFEFMPFSHRIFKFYFDHASSSSGVNSTFGTWSAHSSASKNWIWSNQKKSARKFVGNRRRSILYSLAAALNRVRAVAIRFSVPSSWTIRSLYACVAVSWG